MNATNVKSESALGGTTNHVQQYGDIGMKNVMAVSNRKCNEYFQNIILRKKW